MQNCELWGKNGILNKRVAGLIEATKKLTGELGELQKDNAAIESAQIETRSLHTTIATLQEEKIIIDGNFRKLSVENENYRRQNKELHSRVTQLEQDLRGVQEREYTKTKRKQGAESHEVVSAQFGGLFRRCESWARKYFKLGIEGFEVEIFPPFARELELVSWSETNWKAKKHFKVSHLVQAVLGNILARAVFECPFAGCTWGFHEEFRALFEAKIRAEGEQAAHRWRASSLTTYNQCENWPTIVGPPTETYRIEYLNNTRGLLNNMLLPIITTHFRDRTAEEIRSQGDELFAITKEAMELAAKMSQQASKLVIINKEWFQKNGRKLGRDDDRVKDRLGDGDDNPQADLTVDLILTPGFLKYGNDDAEHLDQYSVWMPAKVDIRNRQGENPPLTNRETLAKEQVEVWGGQGFTQDPPNDLSENKSGNEELPVEEDIL